MEISGLQIFKYLPASKKAEFSNCKECGYPTCMAFAIKLAKHEAKLKDCKHVCDELATLYEHGAKQPQKIIEIAGFKIGGENVLYRHDKTFINKTAIAVIIDFAKSNAKEKLKQVKNFEITRVNEKLKIDLIITKNGVIDNCENAITYDDYKKLELIEIIDRDFNTTKEQLISTRVKAVKEKDEKFSAPVSVVFPHSENLNEVCARASFYICKYANMLVFEDFEPNMVASLMTLRQNIFTDPQKPLQVEAGIYEFNEPDENSLIFMTTNFALTYFAVASELENLSQPSYLIVVPSDGMSVLTAWSAEKFTAQVVVKTLKKFEFDKKVKTKQIIIPGLLAHMKEELEEELHSSGFDFEIIIGTIDAFAINDFVKNNENID